MVFADGTVGSMGQRRPEQNAVSCTRLRAGLGDFRGGSKQAGRKPWQAVGDDTLSLNEGSVSISPGSK